MKTFDFDDDKNKLIFKTRGVTFQDAIDSVVEKGILADFPHPNKGMYPEQRIFVVEIQNYTYCIPYVEKKEKIFLKPIFPSRKFMCLLEGR